MGPEEKNTSTDRNDYVYVRGKEKGVEGLAEGIEND